MRKINTLLSLLFVMWFSVCKAQSDSTVIAFDGTEIPLRPCVEASVKSFEDSVFTVAYCRCLVPRFYQNLMNEPENLSILKTGRIHDLPIENKTIIWKIAADCLAENLTDNIKITSEWAEKMKNSLKLELRGSEVEPLVDVDKYCGCIVDNIQQKFTLREVLQANFYETDAATEVINACFELSLKE